MECKKVSILSMCRHLYNKHSSIDIQNNFHSKQKSQLNSLNIYYECHKNYSFLGKSYCIENFLNRVYILLNNISNEFYLHISNSAKHKYHSSILHPEHICQSSTLSKLIHFNYMKDKMGSYDCTKHILNLTCRLSAESYYMQCLSIPHNNFNPKNNSTEEHKADKKKTVNITQANTKYKQSCLHYKQYSYQRLKVELYTIQEYQKESGRLESNHIISSSY